MNNYAIVCETNFRKPIVEGLSLDKAKAEARRRSADCELVAYCVVTSSGMIVATYEDGKKTEL